MDWNLKWDWENFVEFGSKATESPKKLHLVDWMIDDGGSFNLSNSGASASDGGHVSSAKSSLSASTDTSIKEGTQTPNFNLVSNQRFSGNCNKKMQRKRTDVSETFPHLEASMGSAAEPLIGLKLGKRTYFENNGAGGNVKSAHIPTMPMPSTTALKKTRSSGKNINIPRCVVEGCKIDLSMAKVYHQKHRVCDIHSKCLKVIVGGLERRFCQQCSRFHNLSEFDEEKRSCRRRLSDHNARRRKPQQRTIQFNSARNSSLFYGERQQLSFLLNDSPLVHPRNPVDTTWDSSSTRNSKFTLTTCYPLKSTREGGISESMHFPGIKLPHVVDMHNTAQPLVSKSSVPEVLHQGSEGSPVSSHLVAAPQYRCALSLLSNNNWGPYGPETMPLHENGACVTLPMMHTVPEAVPLSSPESWLAGHQSPNPRFQSFVSNSNFQETQPHVNPYEGELYSHILNQPIAFAHNSEEYVKHSSISKNPIS